MTFIYNDKRYMKIVNDILSNKEFDVLKHLEHHGKTRYEHSLKISYISYKIARFLKLDYIAAARGGLLHDFFVTENERTIKDRLISALTHPFKASENAQLTFGINDKEKNIIESHMFFANYRSLPKYMESWVIILTDTTIGFYELFDSYGSKAYKYANLFVLFLLNYAH